MSAIALVVAGSVITVLPGGALPAADAATVVASGHCRSLDPNLVRGACLRFHDRSRTAYTWIGSYRAANGRVFFCIDYLYDSRITGRPTIRSTQPLVNQFGQRIGDREVAALNYLISRWAAHGSTGEDVRDAAIGLIIRELMSDGIRADGTVVYPPGLKVGMTVRPPIGGLAGPIMVRAQQMWAAASKYYGGYRLELRTAQSGPIELGRTRRYEVAVVSAAGRAVPGIAVRLTCAGPITCPASIRSGVTPVPLSVTPREVGRSRILARADGPAADGRIYQVGGWQTHGGGTAHRHGVQRGWIAERSSATAQVEANVVIVKGTPSVITTTSAAVALPGTNLHDVVEVTSLPAGYHQVATATLFGPFSAQPGPDACVPVMQAASVSFPVTRNGELSTPEVKVDRPGIYVWVESLPGDLRTNPVVTPCGLVPETTQVVPRTPSLRTKASAQRAQVGGLVHDTVVVGGLGAGVRATVHWRLRGPLSSRGSSCTGIDWSRAPIVAQGNLQVVGDGSYGTPSTRLRVPGCISYEEDMSATATTAAAHSVLGQALESVLVTRPVTPFVPEIPTGPFSLTGIVGGRG